jgi:nicotinate-nucleotide adenylyltransferase
MLFGDQAKSLSDSGQSPARIGVFGGTFDPIHNAHIDIGRAARDQARLDRVLFVVAHVPPHKQDLTDASAEDRFAIVDAALADEPGIEASRIELDREGISYTADTLQTLRDLSPSAELFLIIGMDSLIDLPSWRDPDRIIECARLLVVPRPGEWHPPEALEGRYEVIDFDQVDVSSTCVRARIERGEDLGGVVPDAAAEIIRAKGLYGSATKHPAG